MQCVDSIGVTSQHQQGPAQEQCHEVSIGAQPAVSAPFTLLVGDVQANIEAFKAGPVPSPIWTTQWEIHTLLNMGIPVHEIHNGLRTMSRASWSANLTEQGHVAMSQVAKKHPKMKGVTMQDKAFLISAKPLVQKTPMLMRKPLRNCKKSLPGLIGRGQADAMAII